MLCFRFNEAQRPCMARFNALYTPLARSIKEINNQLNDEL